MLQQPKQETEQKGIPINIDEPVNPYQLCNDTYFLTENMLKVIGVGNDHFRDDQKLKDLSPNDIEKMCLYLSDFFTWFDSIFERVTMLARNQFMLVKYLEQSKKAMEEAKEYASSETPIKKRKLERDSDDSEASMDTVD